MNVHRAFTVIGLCLIWATGVRAAPIHDAAANGDVEIIRALVRSGTSVDSQEHEHALTPLMAAAANGRTAVVEALISMGASLSACNKPSSLSLPSRRSFDTPTCSGCSSPQEGIRAENHARVR